MGTLFIRADASPAIGSGHVMRCLALAQSWISSGGRAVLLGAVHSEQLRHRLVDAGVQIEPAPEVSTDAGLSATTAALKRMVEIGREGLVVVLDGYSFGPDYQSSVQVDGSPLLVIDDAAHWSSYHATFILNQNIDADLLPYVNNQSTKMLLGPTYALLRPEFRAMPRLEREIPANARRVLITMGGGDHVRVAAMAIEAVSQAGLPDAQVILLASHRVALSPPVVEAIARSRTSVQVLHDVNEMPAVMAWADIAISGAGSTCWELLFMGVPAVLLVLADNQMRIAGGLHRRGLALSLGIAEKCAVADLAGAVRQLAQDQSRRAQMSQTGRNLVDGQGAERVVAALMADPRIGSCNS